MSDNITLPREVVQLALDAFEAVMPFSTTQRELKIRAVEALRTALAAEQPKPSSNFDNQGAVLLLRSKSAEIERLKADSEALRRDAERWQHWRDSHGFAKIDHEGGRCFVTLICDCDDPNQVRAKRFAGEDSFEWLDAFTDAAMEDKT